VAPPPSPWVGTFDTGFDSAFPGSTGGAPRGFGGGVITDPADNDKRPPRAPQDVTFVPIAGGGIKALWRDQGSPETGLRVSDVVVQDWELHLCSPSLVGATRAPKDVLAKSGGAVATIRSGHRGQFLILTVVDPTMTDVYAQIVGISVNGALGIPSDPSYVSAGGIGTGPLNDVTSPAVNLTAVVDIYGNHFVQVNPSYVAPLVLGRFYGVAIHSTGYVGDSTLIEMGSPIVYGGLPPGQGGGGSLILPRDNHATTLYFVSIDRAGIRRDDPTGAPSVVLGGGIFA
jgi:hypothetical protein